MHHLSDAFSTPYHAIVKRAEVRHGQTVVVFGCGGVGLAALQWLSWQGQRSSTLTWWRRSWVSPRSSVRDPL